MKTKCPRCGGTETFSKEDGEAHCLNCLWYGRADEFIDDGIDPE